MNKKIGVFIAGRLASERLPNKLILPILDTCLWEKALQNLSALPSTVDKYALCTDDALLELARAYPSVKVIRRDPETCKVDGPLTYIFKDLKDLTNTHLMFLNPCLFYLTPTTLTDALEAFQKSSKEYATSVKTFSNWLFEPSGKALMPINYERLTTKEIIPAYQAAHCFHIFNKEQFFDDGQMLKDDFMQLEVPENETVDVDTESDYKLLLYLEEQRQKDEMRYKIDSYFKRGLPVHVVDIDDTICSHNPMKYEEAQPIVENIDYFNTLYDHGDLVIYSTARGYIYSDDQLYQLTKNQLRKWGVKHHYLLVGAKLPASYYWDDKAINVKEFFQEAL